MNKYKIEADKVSKLIRRVNSKFRSRRGHDFTLEQIEQRLKYMEELCEKEGMSPLYVREVMGI